MKTDSPTGPLTGVRILEIGGIGPNPFAGMLLADMGADVLRLDRVGGLDLISPDLDVTLRGRATVRADLKSPQGLGAVLELVEQADALIEGFRPGVMERLGLGPAEVHARNPRLVYGRMTGYGQEGPMATVAGHDVNYISLAGALGPCRRPGEPPRFALNFVGDFGGGAMFLVTGVLAAIIEARSSGLGQVVDAAMVDGAAAFTAPFMSMRAAGFWQDEPGTNLLDGGAHFYDVYETADGGYVAVGAVEPQFYTRLLELLEIPAETMPQMDRARWPEFRERFAEIFRTRDRAAWTALLEAEETCTTVVREMHDARDHPHMAARGTYVEIDGVLQAGAAPRFDRTPSAARPAVAAQDADGVLSAWGLGEAARAALRGEA